MRKDKIKNIVGTIHIFPVKNRNSMRNVIQHAVHRGKAIFRYQTEDNAAHILHSRLRIRDAIIHRQSNN